MSSGGATNDVQSQDLCRGAATHCQLRRRGVLSDRLWFIGDSDCPCGFRGVLVVDDIIDAATDYHVDNGSAYLR